MQISCRYDIIDGEQSQKGTSTLTIFIRHVPIFFIVRKAFSEGLSGINLLFIAALTIYDYVNGVSQAWNITISLCLMLFCLIMLTSDIIGKVKVYLAIREDCAQNINELLNTATENLSPNERKLQKDAQNAIDAGKGYAYLASVCVAVFDAWTANRRKEFDKRHKLLYWMSNATVCYIILITLLLLTARFF